MKIQVYTANVGEHDPPREDPKVHVITEDRLNNPLLSARFYKCSPHLIYSYVDWTIWVDANVWLNVEPGELVQRCIDEGKDYGLFQHTWNRNVSQEAFLISLGGFDTQKNIDRALVKWITLYSPGKLPE